MAQHDYIVENAPGRTVRMTLNGALEALATNNAGATEPPTPYPGMLWLDLSVPPAGLMKQRNQTNTGWIQMLSAPQKATLNEVISGVDDAKYVTPASLQNRIDHEPATTAFNRVVNGAMQHSQENGDTAGTVTAYFMADQWRCQFGGTGFAVSAQRVASTTPRGSKYRIRIAVTTAKVTLATADYLAFYQPIEGIRIADLTWGSAAAKQAVLRFGFKGPAGTYYAGIQNAASNRNYVVPFVISAGQANIETEQTIAVPGDVTGTWPTDNTLSLRLWITLAAGPTLQASANNTWATGNLISGPTQSNGLAALNTFELFDVGFYHDASRSGVAPRWQMPDEAAELIACQRYYQTGVFTNWCGSTTAAALYYAIAVLPVDVRITTATVSGVNLGANAAFPSAVGTLNLFGTRNVREYRAAASATTGAPLYCSGITINARM